MMSEIKNPEAESYELLQKYGESIQDYLKDWAVGKKIPNIDCSFRNPKDEASKVVDQLQNVILHSLEYDEKENVFGVKVGEARFFLKGDAADMIKQGYKSER
ncbi:MAG TPA: hypothetical protein PKH95_01430 [Candidatus Magasanikbacteria bacterium]|nr:hypothetical protein [Candidatus Magasanikbacteria bacterium]